MGRGNQPLNYRQFNVRNTKKKKKEMRLPLLKNLVLRDEWRPVRKTLKHHQKLGRRRPNRRRNPSHRVGRATATLAGEGGGRDRKTIHATWLPNERSFQNEKKKIFLVIFSLSLSVWVQSTSRPRSATSSSTALRVNPSQRVERSENKCAIKWLKYIF